MYGEFKMVVPTEAVAVTAEQKPTVTGVLVMYFLIYFVLK